MRWLEALPCGAQALLGFNIRLRKAMPLAGAASILTPLTATL
jgi:hypothetical protein